MKIILVHYRYFVSGGPERYMFNVTNILLEKGHEVIPFSVRHNKNIPSKHEEYFLDAIGDGDEVYGHEYKKDFATVTKVIARMLYSFEAKRKMASLIKKEKPDLIYILQFQNKMSCSIVDAAYDLGIPIVQRISDFAHICINNTFYNFQLHDVCERCLVGSKVNAVRYRCWQDSLINSVIKAFALSIQGFRRTTKKISAYVVPAEFTIDKHVEFGVEKKKLHHIPTFFYMNQVPEPAGNSSSSLSGEKYFLYFGRIEEEKGLMTLVKAFVNTGFKLVIVGFSGSGFDNVLHDYLKDKRHAIEFRGKLEFREIEPLIEGCIATICPSEWYDNFPNVILESYAGKKPVIATNLGSLSELVIDGKTGLLFESKNVEDLNRCVVHFHDNSKAATEMGVSGFELLKNEFSGELHYARLMKVFNETILKNDSDF